jgi:imidazolonepropionase-like amidohydrolase
MLGFVSLLVLFAICCPFPAAAQRTLAVVGGAVIDGTGAPPRPNAAIVIEGDRIRAVGPAADVQIPPGAEMVDASGQWIIPGLIDAHVHFGQSGGLYTRPDIIDLRSIRPYAEEIARIKTKLPETFARYLASGLTGVVDVGGPMWTFDARALARRTRIAPRVAVAGPLLGTVAPKELSGVEDPQILEIHTSGAARAAVVRLIAQAPDLIKIWFVLPVANMAREMEWVRAAIAAGHAAGVPVVAHATQLRVARVVVEAGVDVLAHSIEDRLVDAALVELVHRRNVVYTTTLVVDEGYHEVLGGRVALSDFERRLGDPEAIASFDDLKRLPRRSRSEWPAPTAVASQNVRRMQAAGVSIAAGSDAGNIGTLHGPALHRELELLVGAGLTPMQALVAATRGSSMAMRRSHEIGTLEPGKLADMVLLAADPLADIRNTRRIHRVLKGGEIFDPDQLLRGFR